MRYRGPRACTRATTEPRLHFSTRHRRLPVLTGLSGLTGCRPARTKKIVAPLSQSPPSPNRMVARAKPAGRPRQNAYQTGQTTSPAQGRKEIPMKRFLMTAAAAVLGLTILAATDAT